MRLGAALLVVVGAAFLLVGPVATAPAAPGCTPESSECPPFIKQFGSFGSGAGQLNNPVGIAADPDTGHIFVANSGLRRIDEFDPENDYAFVKAWGWGVVDGSPELQVCTTATGCMEGLEGAGPGQMGPAIWPTVDEEGFVWVADLANFRVQKFSAAGEFVLMVGGEVNKTKVQQREAQEANAEPVTVTEAEENLCTEASGDVCGGGTPGTGDGEFSAIGLGGPIDVGPDGTIYVGDANRIQEFNEDGSFKGEIPLAGGGTTRSLTVDPTGRIYVISESVKEKISNGTVEQDSRVVREIGPAGEELDRLTGEWQGRKTPKDPLAVAADADGNVYVIGTVIYDPAKIDDPPIPIQEIVAFDKDGNLISFEPGRAGFGRSTDDSKPISINTNVVGDGSGDPGEVLVGHFFNGAQQSKPFLSYVRVYGVPYLPQEGEPEIESTYALAVGTKDAKVEALINPRFTSDTTFQVQYGTEPCSAGGCTQTAPATPVALGGGAVNVGQKTGPVGLTGLEPGTTYHYRFIATNGVGGPVEGPEGTFRTYRAPELITSCANQAFRVGPAAQLPDCRAYEKVTSPDGEVLPTTNLIGYPATLEQADPSGEELTFSSTISFADPQSTPHISQYLAERQAGGWVDRSISPPREGPPLPGLDNQFKAFSEDLSRAWLVTETEPALDEGAIPDYRNLYQRDNAADDYGIQCPVEPPGIARGEYRFDVQGYTEDGSHLVFRTNADLTESGSGSTPQVYDCVNGTELRLVSTTDGTTPSSSGASAGIAGGSFAALDATTRRGNVIGAVSQDGSRIFWTAAVDGPGPLYVRIGGTETVQIAASNARFRQASPDGSRVLYSIGETLYEASVEPGSAVSDPIAGELEGLMGASEDTTLVYLVSREDLDDGAEAGKPNLYLYRSAEDSFTYIATLAADDAREIFNTEERLPVLTPVAIYPVNRSSRVSADGLHAAFTSIAPLTGYDNTDRSSEEADAEVFRYDADAEELLCASCNPSGARPRGANVGDPAIPFWAAAKIPGWQNQLTVSEVMSANGNRLYFEAIDSLAVGDTNGAQDVYQWQAPGSGTCTEASATYSSSNGGCVDLISSGKSPRPSAFVDIGSDARDVFFKTASSLVSTDPELIDIYDARVGGGFSVPDPPAPPCEGGNCQSPGPAPNVQTPSSATFVGPGNVVEKARKPKKCRKGTKKVKKAGKVRCVKVKKKNKQKARAGNDRRAGR